MTPVEIRDCIRQAAAACIAQDGQAFAALFHPEGELVLPGSRIVGKGEIEQVTTKYLGTCENIRIQIQRVIIDGMQAVVEWLWLDEKKSGQFSYAENAIVVDFQEGLIVRWREYTDTKTQFCPLETL
ncbi:nuclear transport factor 2 family protein [Spirulina subsalsa FACHB-351]|uniref:Nuclear transport factor 2 family protein n=1 Tax=Spirulina subsalsa FACHB-351 TaxID=234711 RepID=A0ABT3L8W3_9CYAN|nr:nuclear transport factor 2 family protein [Spirulina subsalsa]MCW6037943.1 nuclear transport factor 2 family protein [Spirulina subsalsa FACHB-351]